MIFDFVAGWAYPCNCSLFTTGRENPMTNAQRDYLDIAGTFFAVIRNLGPLAVHAH